MGPFVVVVVVVFLCSFILSLKSEIYFKLSRFTVLIYLLLIVEVVLSASDVNRRRAAFLLFLLFQHISSSSDSNFPEE